MLEYLFFAFIVIVGIQFLYFIIFSFFSFSKLQKVNQPFTKPISVLICAKNEAANLTENIPYFLNQAYPNFELVLINDGSTDETLEIIEQFEKKHHNIKVVNVVPNEQFWGSKKYALTLGIKAATYEHLLFSDADCKPASKKWISQIVQSFNNKKQLILGYGAHKKIKNSFLNKIIRFETLLTAIQYFSYAKIGIPYMGVGRNLAYTKSLFFENNGFVNHMKIKSGDDDLFINEVAKKSNTSIQFSKDSFTISTPKTSFNEWILQKRRHISTASRYKKIHKFLLSGFYTSNLLFWLLALVLLSFLFQWKVVLILLLSRVIFQFILYATSAKKLNENDLIMFIPFFEPFLILIQLFIFIKNLSSKPTHW
jgi:glycosyltransferase involved in cell wall biosynthesis